MSTKMIVFNIMKLFMKLPLKLSSAAASGWLAACLPACAASRDLEVNAALLSPLTELGWHPMNREEKKRTRGKEQKYLGGFKSKLRPSNSTDTAPSRFLFVST